MVCFYLKILEKLFMKQEFFQIITPLYEAKLPPHWGCTFKYKILKQDLNFTSQISIYFPQALYPLQKAGKNCSSDGMVYPLCYILFNFPSSLAADVVKTHTFFFFFGPVLNCHICDWKSVRSLHRCQTPWSSSSFIIVSTGSYCNGIKN